MPFVTMNEDQEHSTWSVASNDNNINAKFHRYWLSNNKMQTNMYCFSWNPLDKVISLTQ